MSNNKKVTVYFANASIGLNLSVEKCADLIMALAKGAPKAMSIIDNHKQVTINIERIEYIVAENEEE